jgi:hypothetical protein
MKWRMEPTGSNKGVVHISVANESVPTFKNMFKAFLWAILIKAEVRKDVERMWIVNKSYTRIHIQSVPGEMCQTSGWCSLC